MKFEINITSYKRPKLLNEFISELRKSVSDHFIRVWDNSPEPIEVVGADEVRWHRFNPSLSRVWNWAIAQSRTEWVMVANDDLFPNAAWFSLLMGELEASPNTLWHGPSRMFLFNKKLLDSVGWFDERLRGLCYEDLDYVRRMNYAGVPICYGKSCSLSYSVADKRGQANRVRYEADNHRFFCKKYEDHNREVFEGRPIFPTPDFYPNRPETIPCE